MPCPTFPQNFRKIRPYFFSYLANTQTNNRQNITSLAEVIRLETRINTPKVFVKTCQQMWYNCMHHKQTAELLNQQEQAVNAAERKPINLS